MKQASLLTHQDFVGCFAKEVQTPQQEILESPLHLGAEQSFTRWGWAGI